MATTATASHDDDDAILLLSGGKIYTCARDITPWAEAAVIADAKFAYVGTARDARAFCEGLVATRRASGGAAGRTIVVKEEVLPAGSLVLPGFIDAHCHPLAAGTKEMTAQATSYCDISRAVGLEDALEICRRYAAKIRAEASNSGGCSSGWVLGGGWRDDWFTDRMPKAAYLDEAFGPEVPVMLRRWDMHACWCSSWALELAGVMEDTVVECPKGGQVVLDEGGRAVGVFYDAAQDLIVRAIPPLSHEVRSQALRLALSRMVSYGITGYLEALVKNERQLAVYEGVYDNRVESESLPWGCLALQCKNEDDIRLLQARRGQTGDRLHLRMAKLMVDGVMESLTAALHEPYQEPAGRCCCVGTLNFDTEDLRRLVSALDGYRVPIHCHCVGDKATTEVLDAIEAGRTVNHEPWDSRHTIAHLQLVRPSDVPRFSHLGVVANFTPYWLTNSSEMEAVIAPLLGPAERANQQYPIRDLLDQRAHVSFGSDWPVDGVLDPLLGIEVAITHRVPGSSYPAWLPQQLISLEEAVAAYTIGAAYACHAEDHTGSISPGKDADLVVLDRDLFSLKTEEIHTAQVLMTFIRGRKVFMRHQE